MILYPSCNDCYVIRDDFDTLEDFNKAVRSKFRDNPGVYITFNGRRFDHKLLDEILDTPGESTDTFMVGTSMSILCWKR